jgi:hypothetical protein
MIAAVGLGGILGLMNGLLPDLAVLANTPVFRIYSRNAAGRVYGHFSWDFLALRAEECRN